MTLVIRRTHSRLNPLGPHGGSWRRESSPTISGSVKMDSCLVLTECFSRRIPRFRTSAIDLIHSKRVSTSTSSFFAHRLAYSSDASMIMPKFWCHENETGSLYFGPLLKRSLSFTLRTILRSPVTIWPHGAYRKCESEQLQGGRSWERPWKSSCCKRFGSNRTGIAIGNAWRLTGQLIVYYTESCSTTLYRAERYAVRHDRETRRLEGNTTICSPSTSYQLYEV